MIRRYFNEFYGDDERAFSPFGPQNEEGDSFFDARSTFHDFAVVLPQFEVENESFLLVEASGFKAQKDGFRGFEWSEPVFVASENRLSVFAKFSVMFKTHCGNVLKTLSGGWVNTLPIFCIFSQCLGIGVCGEIKCGSDFTNGFFAQVFSVSQRKG